MKVKKYIANTMPEAMHEIRKELGSDAVILQSKEVKKKGILGLFKKSKIEVVAAIDPQPIQNEKKKVTNESQIIAKQSNLPKKDNHEILNEIKNLKNILELQSKKAGMDISTEYQLALEHLLDQEVDATIAEEIIQEVANELEGKEVDLKEINQTITSTITEKLAKYPPEGITGDKNIIQFVGPTGVGKTTTIAKVAAKLMLEDKKKVAFITTDTYRIAAIEQLKTYARILNVPLEVAYNVEDYQKALEKLAAYDLILVDTAGRNFRDTKYIKELKEMIGDSGRISTYLVLSLTAKPKDLNDIYDQFYQIPITGMIFTKIDETTQYGSMLNIVLNKQIGIAYVTNGQDVPDNILHLTPQDLSELIVGEQNE